MRVSVSELARPAELDAPPAPTAQASLAELARRDGVRFIMATFTTLLGKPCSKLVPVDQADALQADGAGFAGYAAGGMGQQPRDPDIIAVPDVRSYAALPFVRPGLAMVHCDPHVEGQPYPFAPRVILGAALVDAARDGLDLMTGAELEYFLVTRDAEGRISPADQADRADQPCYDARGVTRMYDHLTSVSGAMAGLGWGPYASDHEDGNGQFEQNFAYADAMTTADRIVTARFVIQMLAEQRGMTATFMPKPWSDRTGNGMHLHLSLWRDGIAAFPLTRAAADPYGLGLSPIGYHFVAGLLAHAPALAALVAPTVNSYKRTGAATTNSGATWAPSRASYGGNDRTHMVRVPDDQRVELRAGDGAATSYLAIAAALAAGLDGVRGARDPGAPGAHGDDAPTIPRTLLDAVHALEADPVLSAVLDGAVGARGVADYYADLKREEFYRWHSQVSPWEIEQYLTAV